MILIYAMDAHGCLQTSAQRYACRTSEACIPPRPVCPEGLHVRGIHTSDVRGRVMDVLFWICQGQYVLNKRARCVPRAPPFQVLFGALFAVGLGVGGMTRPTKV